MVDLNQLYYFAKIVEYGGISEASKHLRIPKSKLSRHLAALEEELGVRLIHRTTRHFSVTDIGQTYYTHCQAMLEKAEIAQASIMEAQTKPRGLIRITCPITLLHMSVENMITSFVKENPEVEMIVDATNRRVDLVHEGVDIALRVIKPPFEDSEYVMKRLSVREQVLVASPDLINQIGKIVTPETLHQFPSLAHNQHRDRNNWELIDQHNNTTIVPFNPKFMTTDLSLLRKAALNSIGIVKLPLMVVHDDIKSGKLIRILPDWHFQDEVVHAVYPSRRGVIPAIRSFLDHLESEFAELDKSQC
ncbi:LysR substrate-binding domain-containing protein [Wohlfahrtiimonas larvae]|uniref:LysR family transcriptional regulator n=1 Tax=Wohlfahrtiimonas larvae TaxID=1157986 RepID=A0ABP9MRF9_9GAMM|nr:LysR substrate-binding domain-containing protein [Wohlfahrtiimonas larvae]